MSGIDGAIIVFYLLVMMAIGLFVGRGNHTQEDYFVAGRSMPWLPVALSVAATMISANSFIGGPGWAYTDGIQPFMQNVTVPLACFLAVTVTVPVFYNLKVSSIYEYMEKRLGKYSRMLAVLQFFINSLIQVSSMVFVPALIIQAITGWSLNLVVPMIVICAIVYTIAGGIKAVIWTDAIQMIVLWGGILVILYIALKEGGHGLTETIKIAADAGKYDALDFDLDVTKTNAFFCSCFGIFMWTRYFCFDQSQMQRILTSKSMHGIKKSYITSTLLMNTMYFLMLFLGTIFFVAYGGKTFASSNEIMIDFVLHKLPVGVKGLVIAAIFAAAMSSVDSLLNSMTTVFTKDIYERYFLKGKQSEGGLKQAVCISAVLGVIIIAIVILAFGGSVKSVIDVVGGYISYFAGPALGAFLLAMFTTKANDRGVACGFGIGFVGGYALAKYWQTSWLINPAIGAVITLVIGYLLSMVFKPERPVEETVKYTALGMKREIEKNADGKSSDELAIPFTIDKYGIALLGFFALQYVFLFFIQR